MKKIGIKNISSSSLLSIILYLSCIFIVIALIVWGCSSPALSSGSDKFKPKLLHGGWSQQIGDDFVELDDIHDYIPVEQGEQLIFTCTLPDVRENYVFLFYSLNKEVWCYVDGELINEFAMQDGFSILKTPGSAWNQVDLESSMSGKTCTLIFNSPLGDYTSLCDIYFIENQYVNTVRLEMFWQSLISVVEILFIALIIVITAIVSGQKQRKRYLLSIAQYFIILLLWLLAELNFYDIIFKRPIISYLLSEFFYRMLPIALLYLAKNSTNQYWHPKIFKGVRILAWINLFMPFVLQFVFEISLLETRIMHLLTFVVISIVMLLVIIEKIFNFKKLEYGEYPCIVVSILTISSGLDCIILFFSIEYNPFAGVLTAVGGIIFSFVSLIILTYVNSCIAHDKIKIEQSYNELENIALVKQVEAHFIFNALNTISAFCKTDPQEADRATKAFAGYLRSYIHLLNQNNNISIEKELKLVENYLIIQQMRFGDKVQFSFDAEFFDFQIPPFILQTLVENSIIHGILTSEKGGIVVVSVKKKDNVACIIVSDNGIGFDINILPKESSVGLLNAKKRLKKINNSSITIESTVGIGTVATIEIPLDYRQN